MMIPTLAGGGAERSFLNLAAGFQRAGYQVDLILKKKVGALADQVPEGVRTIDLNAPRMAATLPGPVRYLLQNRPQALITGLDLPNLLAVIAARLTRSDTTVIVTIRQVLSKNPRYFLPHRSLERAFMRRVYPHADQIVAISQGTARDFAEYLEIPRSRVKVIYNPTITPELLEKAKEGTHHSWFAPNQPPVILGAGRLEPDKDFPTLIRAFKIVRDQRAARLIILGEGSQRPELESLVEMLGLRDEVLLPGFQNNQLPYIKAAAVFVLSSRQEAFGNVLVEAMVCNCPIVATDCPGAPAELLDYGKYGHLTPVGDENSMAAAILDVLAGNGRRPPRTWLEKFELNVILQQYLELL